MAGTYGSFFSLPLCWAILYWGGENSLNLMFWAAGIIFCMGLIFVKKAEQDIGPRKDWKRNIKIQDQNEIVIDEVLGMLIAHIPLTFTDVSKSYLWALVFSLLAFGLFRFFDIKKIWPVRLFDNMKNPFGVMMDDVIAGIQAHICLSVILLGMFIVVKNIHLLL